MVHDRNGHLFLQRRNLSKDTFPGCWDSSCSGHLDASEIYEIAARRELGEELGWHDTSLPLRPLLKLGPCAENGHEFIQIYLMGPCAGPFDLHPGEISEGRWIVPGELDILISEYPDHVAGALRLLWTGHRAEILANIKSNLS
jgi:isopentenyldiphosphate isomerase